MRSSRCGGGGVGFKCAKCNNTGLVVWEHQEPSWCACYIGQSRKQAHLAVSRGGN